MLASIVNTAAFAVGAVAPRLFPLDVAVFAALVFIASMGAVFGATVARCGTMPPTAFLSGVFLTEHESVAASVLLFAVGGLWYAVATMALTPAPPATKSHGDYWRGVQQGRCIGGRRD